MRSVYADLPDAARYAGFWIRVFANVLDLLLFGAVNMAVMMTADEWWPQSLPPGVGSVSGPDPRVVFVTTLLPIIAIVSSWIALGASPGKLICGLRIIDEPTGGSVTPSQCVGRYLMGLLVLALGGIGYVYLVIDPRKQGLHDKIVRTLVVHRT